MPDLILPPGFQREAARTASRARFWHDYRYPGDVARAIVVAQKEGRQGPKVPEQCPNRDCVVCHPGHDEQGRITNR